MNIKRIVVGSLQENCYLLYDSQKKAIIIDPGAEAEHIFDFVKDYSIKGILVTHYHFDHIGALAELEKRFQVKANDFAKLKDFSLQVFELLGHTMDSKSFYFPDCSSLFVGDFVFQRGIGRMDLGGDVTEMKKSLSFLLTHFPDQTILYPGHGNVTTLQEERSYLTHIMNYEL